MTEPARGKSVLVATVGDTTPGPRVPDDTFEFVREELRSADLRFAQVERTFSSRGSYQNQSISPHTRVPSDRAAVYSTVPFDVVSIASNHVGDWGEEAVIDTVETFRLLGIKTIGAGRNISEARQAAIIECKGIRIAFLGYCSVLLPQYWATESRGGAAPMRAKTYYEPYEFQPGAPVRIVTLPDPKDLVDLQEDVRRAKENADVVIVSFHWGVHFVPKPLATYQPVVAHAAIDAGASVVVGHHPHVLQAMEIYRGAAIFYSLGNFAFYRRPGSPLYCLPNGEFTFQQVYTRPMEPDYTYEWNRYWSESAVAFFEVDKQGVRSVKVLPTMIDPEGRAIPLRPGTDDFEATRNYLAWVSRDIPGGVSDIGTEGNRLVVFQRQAQSAG